MELRMLSIGLGVVLAILAVAATFGSTPARAEIFGAVHGIVHDPQVRPVQDAIVDLKAQRSEWIQHQRSNGNGEFDFSAVPFGEYTVTVTVPNFQQCRDIQGVHTDGAFLFPQMTLSPEVRREMGEDKWRPGFVDYLFLAFNTSTAFSPTDVPVLSRWAKALMMIQSCISLATIALLAARAVNIL